MADKKWDLSTREGRQGAAGWIRNRGKALVVLVITDEDVTCSIDPKLEPYDVVELLRSESPRLLQYLIARRASKKGKVK